MSIMSRLFLGLAGKPPFNKVYRSAIQLRYRLLQRVQKGQPVLEQVAGFPLIVLPQVLNPRLFYSGKFLAQALDRRLVPEGGRVLDLGTGSGIVALACARLGARVVATDISPLAVRSARINALLNQVEAAIDIRQGDLFDPVSAEQFDLVIFNPPYFSGEPQSLFEQALYSSDIIERFGDGLAAHLTPGGYGLLLLSSLAEEERILRSLQQQGWTAQQEVVNQLPLERLALYRLVRRE
jgi:release factor glutamine methyltransferase